MSRRKVGVILFAIALTTGLAAGASAQSPFAIDGDPTNGNGIGTPFQFTDPDGNAQEVGPINGSGTKVGVINTAASPMLGTTNPNGQTDLKNVWLQTAVDGSGVPWLYFAWERDANSGSGVTSFEFQHAKKPTECNYSLSLSALNTAGCNPWKGRQAGDFLIIWDWSGSTPTLAKRVFALGPGGKCCVLGTSQPLGTVVAATRPDGFTGDAAVSLTDLLTTDSCDSIANVIPGTITGNSDTADYKDTVLQDFFGLQPTLKISNCGTVTVTKKTTPTAGATGTFQYTLARADSSAIDYQNHTSSGNTFTHGDTAANPASDGLVVKAGDNYTLGETAPGTPWTLQSVVCTLQSTPPVTYNLPPTQNGTDTAFKIVASTVTDCTITNRRQQATLTVYKHVIIDNGGLAVASNFTMFLNDSGNRSFSGSELGVQNTFDAGGSFNVTESTLTGYTQLARQGDCQISSVADGATYSCTLTNDDNAPSLTLIKRAINDNGGTHKANEWTLGATGSGTGATSFSGTGACQGSCLVGDSTATLSNPASFPGNQGFHVGSYTLSESGSGLSGYAASSWSCVKNNGNPVPGSIITLALGETATCTITNNDNKAVPTGVSDQSSVLHDFVSIAGITTGANPAGTVTFSLHLAASCADAAVATPEGPIALSLAGSTGTAGTTTGVLVNPSPVGTPPNTTASGTYFWKVDYSGDQYNSAFSLCNESTAVTFTPK